MPTTGQFFGGLGQMRMHEDFAGERGLGGLGAESNLRILPAAGEGAGGEAEVFEKLHVDLTHGEAVRLLALGEELTVFGDQTEPGVNPVGRALALAGSGEDHAALEAAGIGGELQQRVVRGADSLGEGGHLHDQRRAGHCVGRGGRAGEIHFVPKLGGNLQSGDSGVGKEQLTLSENAVLILKAAVPEVLRALPALRHESPPLVA